MNIISRVSKIIAQEAAAVAAVKVTPLFEIAVIALRDCRGKVVTTGIGKAGHAARKFADTLSSTGTPAVFIHPAEAVHGSLGLIDRGDCIVAFSTSGKSDEVIEMLTLAKQLYPEMIIGITSHLDSPLRYLCDIVLDMGPVQEPCLLGLTPTASILVMLAIADSLALVLMEVKRVTRSDYGLRHHGGYLGRKALSG